MVNTSHNRYKKDEECRPITLIMREYYGNESSKARCEKGKKSNRDRYATDMEYKERVKEKSRVRYQTIKAVKEQERLENERKDTPESAPRPEEIALEFVDIV
jgi:hypothetical protein